MDERRAGEFSEAHERAFHVANGAQPIAPWKQVGRLFTDPRFAYRVIGKRIGLKVPLEVEDRRVLERIIFPGIMASGNAHTVLFVGCDWYTRHYEAEFFKGADFWTLEPDPAHRRYGARQHFTAPLEALAEHAGAMRFDVIICNGVYGWGLDDRVQCETAFEQCRRQLRDGGLLVLGWDAIPARDPAPLSSIQSLQRFEPWEFPALGTSRYETDTPYRHTYAFYRA